MGTSLERWKLEKQIKKAKKASYKQLISEGCSHKLAKYLVNQALNRMGSKDGKDSPE